VTQEGGLQVTEMTLSRFFFTTNKKIVVQEFRKQPVCRQHPIDGIQSVSRIPLLAASGESDLSTKDCGMLAGLESPGLTVSTHLDAKTRAILGDAHMDELSAVCA
jgi:hypothetical protein